MAYVDHISVDGVQYDIRDAEAVSFEQEQTLNDVQQEQARANIGAGSEVDVADLKSQLPQLAVYGYYDDDSEAIDHYLELTAGGIRNDGSIENNTKKAYIYLTSVLEAQTLEFDDTVYKYNLCYKNGSTVASYTGWKTTSPVEIDSSIAHDTVGVTFTTLSNTSIPSGDLDNILRYITGQTQVGNLATKDYVDSAISSYATKDYVDSAISNYVPAGRRCIYPDGFVSRIKPDIYFNGRYFTDLDTDDYKIAGAGEVWVATDGSDTTGDGSEDKPYATITKALSQSVPTIKVKAGTYAQGTHYVTTANFTGKNIIGVGSVIFADDSAGHYTYVSGSAYFENIAFEHGNADVNTAFGATCTASGQTVCFVDCVFRNGGTNGLSATGIDVICVRCTAYGNKLDGFNYHDKTASNVTYIPNVLEIDCIAYDNGTSESGSDSCNGSTAHDGTKIVRLNGEYYSCYGGVIAEIARTGEEPTMSVNYGVLAHDSTGTGSYKASFWASINTQMYLYDCQSYGGDYDISAINDAKVVSWRLTTGRDNPSVNAASTATVIQH